ncbi:MAG: choice-of-anchor J domain-containing protein [Chitinophagales bacterium]
MMKKITLLMLALFLGYHLQAQIYYSEDFSTQTAGSAPAGFTILNEDACTPNAPTVYTNSAWITLDDGAPQGNCAKAQSWSTPVGCTVDDWLITPVINLTGAVSTTMLNWSGKSNDSYLETYEVLVSTTNTLKTSFSVLTTITDEPDAWTTHSLSLSAYVGGNIYLAFRLISSDEDVCSIDDILVSGTPVSNLSLENTNINGAVKQTLNGYIPNFVVDFTEKTNVVFTVDVKNTGGVAASSFMIESTVSDETGTITDVVTNTVNATIAPGAVYTYTLPAKNLSTLFPAQAADEVFLVEHILLSNSSNTILNAGDSTINFIASPIASLPVPFSSSFEIQVAGNNNFDQSTWGWKYIDNNNDDNSFKPYNFTNIAKQTGDYCVIGSIINGNSLSLGATDETLQSPNLSFSAGDQLDFSIYAYAFSGQTGSIDLVLTDETGSFTTNLGTISVGVNDTVPTKYTFSSTIAATQNDFLVNINKTSSGFILLDLFEIVVSAPPACNAGVLSTVGFPLNHCPGDSFTISTDGSESTQNDFALVFSPQAGATGANGTGFTISGVTFPYTGDEGLNGVLAANGVPNLSGNWAVYTSARDAANAICSQSTDSVIVNFLASNDPLCGGANSPCVTAANTYNNLVTAGGAPCDDGTGCSTTDAGFTTFGIFGSEAYELTGVQAGFDYTFDMCSGTGAGAWIPAITIVAPSGAVDAFNLGTTGTFLTNCSLNWTATESGMYTIVIHEAGLACGTETSVDNGNPTVTCGANAATCLPCVAGGLVSSSNVVVCGTAQDSIVLDGTESTPGSYEVAFDNAAGGTGAGNIPFTITNVDFPFVFDNDIDGVLSSQNPALPPLSGMWEMTVYNADAFGVYCDSIMTTINVNFVDSTSPLCAPTANCAISSITVATQTACNSATNTYEQDLTVTFTDAPATGTLDVNGQSFAIGTSPQTVTLSGLTADGNAVDVVASFSDDAACTLVSNNLFTAPVACNCAVDVVDATTQSACNPANNTYSQDVVVTYSNAPATGTLDVNGQSFAIGTSPQTVTLSNLVSDGNNVDIVASFSAIPACTLTQTAGFTAPVSCTCLISDLTASTQTPCVNTTNTYTQDVIVTYTNAPATGSLIVNGQTFAIMSSPQTVTLTGLPANNTAVDGSASFTASASCTYSENNLFTAPVGCLCPTINVNVSTTQVSDCVSPNGSATAVATGGAGGYTFAWTPNSFGNGPTISNIPSGSYSVVATDVNGCFGTGSGNVTNSSGVNALLGPTSMVTCNGGSNGSISISASGGTAPISYTWSDQPGVPTTVSTKNNLPAGSYTVTVADAGNCDVTLGPIVITEPDELVVVVDNFSPVTCNGANDGEINTTVSGGNTNFSYSYSWTNGGGNMPDADNLDGGNYVLTVTNGTCPTVSTNSVTIIEPAVISINLDGITDLDCNGDNYGSVLVTTSGGTGSLSYVWDNAPNVEDVLNANGGNYQLTVTDDNMCTVTSPVYTIDEPAELVINVTATTDVSCLDGNDGSITTNITGGTGVYNLLWTNGGGTSGSPSNLSAGSYQLSVTDANMCNAVSSLIDIAEPSSAVSATITSTPESNSSADGTATVVASGGTAPYNFLWSDAAAQTNSVATGLTAGSYSCEITDVNDCLITVSVEVGKVNSIANLAVSELNIYPNPTEGSFNIAFETSETIDFDISIMNTIGKTVMTSSYENVNGSFNEQFTLGNLSSGIYFVEISNKDAKSVYKITLSK